MKKYFFWVLKNVAPVFQSTGLQRVWPIKHIYNFFITNLKPPVVTIHGATMFLDTTDSLKLSIHGECERLQTALFKEVLKKEDVVLDIGAHIGYYTLIAGKSVGPRGKVYAFEPDPERFSLLLKNVRYNRYKNVVCINKAAFNRNRKMNLPILFDQTKPTVEVIRLDDFFKNKETKIDVVKIDIDGGEMAALEGMTQLLKNNHNIKLFIEFWPAGLKIFGTTSEKYFTFLKKLGFTFLQIDEKERTIKSVSEQYLIKKYSPKILRYKVSYTNLFCFR